MQKMWSKAGEGNTVYFVMGNFVMCKTLPSDTRFEENGGVLEGSLDSMVRVHERPLVKL